MNLEHIRNLSRLGIEVWKDIPDFVGYQASNLGNIRSFKRNKIKIKKLRLDNRRRYKVNLFKGKIYLTGLSVSVVVAMVFLNHKPCGYKLVVDHIDNNPSNNRLYNLQVITQRQNSSKDKKGTSKYVGVSWSKSKKKWVSQITLNKKVKHLGYFTNELEAANAYEKALKELENEEQGYDEQFGTYLRE